uniref:Uncharacterized protein n=1 Tax=Vibrio splendidus TaxID=29497 RepID=A0A0H4A3K7_VIBSP|nr:hypothetical protein [Vibrio splendidus]
MEVITSSFDNGKLLIYHCHMIVKPLSSALTDNVISVQ